MSFEGKGRATALWSALLYPSLPLERQGRVEDGRPRAVAVRRGARRLVLLADELAGTLGVHPGQRLGDALALVPALHVEEHDERAQTEHLHQLTLQALRFSSRVTAHPPDSVLVEVRGSLRLFGGLAALLEAMHEAARTQGVTLRIGTAPTPAAASLLARAGREEPVRSLAALGTALADVPLECLSLEPPVLAGLRRSGLRRLGQLVALPPATLTRRFGRAVTGQLYRLDGRLPDPQTAFVPPPTFSAAADLTPEASGTAGLAFPLWRLLGALEGFCRARDVGVLGVELMLFHRRSPPSAVRLRFVEATSDIAHLRRVVTERLDGTRLPAPVTRVSLVADELGEVVRGSPVLIGDGMPATTSLAELADRLVARFGERAVYVTSIDDDHRPEKAWVGVPLGTGQAPVARASAARALAARSSSTPSGSARSPRPLWLLHTPRLATEALQLAPDAERIENGWWDETDVRRDYFVAHDGHGTHYWVFRLRHDPVPLWIHGVFA